MTGLKWRATEAAPVGLAVAALIACVVFKADLRLLAVESAKGVWSALVVLIVVWPAILLYEISNEARAFDAIKLGLSALLPNELLRILGVGVGFVGFLIGITGFGVPVAVGAPLLIGLGVRPIYAVIIALIGESWGSTFGTLAVAWDALAGGAELGADPQLLLQTALWAGILIWIWNLIVCLLICWLYGKREGLKKGWPVALLLSLVQGGGQLLIGQWNQTIACFLPTCLAMLCLAGIGRLPRYQTPWQLENSTIMDRSRETQSRKKEAPMNMGQAFLPYLMLTAITLLVLLVPPVKQALGRWSIAFSVPETVTGFGFANEAAARYSPISPLTHASLFLLLSALTGLWYYRAHGWIKRECIGIVFRRSISKTAPSAYSVIGFLIMSKIMSGSGQTTVLATGMANALGQYYVLFAPLVGLLGAFMTSSNMASNILFAQFQKMTAGLLGVNVAAVLGAQTAGGAIGTATCPGNIILGCTTADIAGEEGSVLKKTLPVSIAAAVLLGLLLLAVTLTGG